MNQEALRTSVWTAVG